MGSKFLYKMIGLHRDVILAHSKQFSKEEFEALCCKGELKGFEGNLVDWLRANHGFTQVPIQAAYWEG